MITYDLEKYSRSDCPNNSDNIPCLPFKMNYWMFCTLCDAVQPLTLSELYDKTFLEQELWNRICSQVLRDYMSKIYKEV